MEVLVVEVYPLQPSPTFRPIAGLHIPHLQLIASTVTNDHCSLHYEEQVTVWNFIKNLWVTWDVDSEYEKVDLHCHLSLSIE